MDLKYRRKMEIFGVDKNGIAEMKKWQKSKNVTVLGFDIQKCESLIFVYYADMNDLIEEPKLLKPQNLMPKGR